MYEKYYIMLLNVYSVHKLISIYSNYIYISYNYYIYNHDCILYHMINSYWSYKYVKDQ